MSQITKVQPLSSDYLTTLKTMEEHLESRAFYILRFLAKQHGVRSLSRLDANQDLHELINSFLGGGELYLYSVADVYDLPQGHEVLIPTKWFVEDFENEAIELGRKFREETKAWEKEEAKRKKLSNQVRKKIASLGLSEEELALVSVR